MPDFHRILIVEDATNARTALVALLRDEGFEVETAASGLETLAKLTRFEPHVVITQMTGIDGLKQVTKLLQTANPPAVLVMTAFGENRLAVEALRAGAEAYLTRPINVDELLLVLRRAIKHCELEREIEELRQARGELQRRAVAR